MKKKNDEHTEDLNKQIEEWKSKYLRALADYQNLEKRTSGEVDAVRKYASEYIIFQLLPVLDSLERAQEHINDKGLELIIKQFHEVFSQRGVTRIDVVGKDFDPREMECIEIADGEENKVISQIRPGYRMYDKVIRAAQVKVGKNSGESDDAQSGADVNQTNDQISKN
jgi:molecular chaperone GrpE